MPRHLPWKVTPSGTIKSESRPASPSVSAFASASASASASTPAPASPSPAQNGPSTPRRQTPLASGDERRTPRTANNGYRSAGASRRSNLARNHRSPSTSPPPEPLSESFMIEGLENDDQYRMVEDEFFVMAGKFTAHLHATEYHRLKNQARSQNVDTIANISRPTVGSLTELARKRQEDFLRRKKQREALRQANADLPDGEDQEEIEEPFSGTSLEGLMNVPRMQEVSLTALARRDSRLGSSASVRPSSRSALGTSLPPLAERSTPVARQTLKRNLEHDVETDEDDDDDDLDAPVQRTLSTPKIPESKPRPIRHTPKQPSSTPVNSMTAFSSPSELRKVRPNTTNNTLPTPRPVKASGSSRQEAISIDEDDGEDDDIFTRFKNRRQRDQQKRSSVKHEPKEEGSKSHQDVIPSFI